MVTLVRLGKKGLADGVEAFELVEHCVDVDANDQFKVGDSLGHEKR